MYTRDISKGTLKCIQCVKEKSVDDFYVVHKGKHRDSLCKSCRVARALDWSKRNRKRKNATTKKSRERRRFFNRCKEWLQRQNHKYNALKQYGKDGQLRCCWPNCDVRDLDMLSLDHVHNDGGGNHRGRENMGQPLYRKLARLKWPIGFQTLCANHQIKKEILRYRAIMDKRLEEDKLKLDWESTERQKAPWIKETVKYGQAVVPQKDQKSNNDFSDDLVLQKRDEPIGTSAAPPISGRQQSSGTWNVSPSKQKYSDSGASGLV